MCYIPAWGRMARLFRRKKNSILFLIIVGGLVFIFFQLFSVRMLSGSVSSHSGHNIERDAQIGHGDSDKVEFEQNDVIKVQGQDSKQVKGEKGTKQKRTLPLGVHRSRSNPQQYLPKNGMFKCIKTGVEIPFSYVNDDFCDCDDSSDEPGTSACPNSVFYCTFQDLGSNPVHIPSSRVNDGICDCCDGSDEWKGNQVPPNVHIQESKKPPVSYTPCVDTCQKVLKMQEEDEKIRAMGKRLKTSYIEAGRKAVSTDLYGPSGVFYKLSETCFDFESSPYTYTLCPFKSVTQKKFPSSSVSLGKSPKWIQQDEEVFVLEMSGGESQMCPELKPRSTTVIFICGLQDRILQVSEDEKCAYLMKFSTPAAC